MSERKFTEAEYFEGWKQVGLTELLLNGKATVVFTKVDGTERTMECTLDSRFIPADKMPKLWDLPKSVVDVTGQTMRVFDTQIGEWRSFRKDSVKSIISDHIAETSRILEEVITPYLESKALV